MEVATFWRGFDFWDGSYVLLLVDLPDASRTAGEIFLFQHVLNPLFTALGRDVALFRLAGLLLLVGASIAATSGIADALRRAEVPVAAGWERMACSVSAACATTAYVGAARVPGYRIVVLIGLLLVLAGLARLGSGKVSTGAALVGASAVLVFTGKPTSAAALFIVVLVAVALLVPRHAWARAVLSGLAGTAGAMILVLWLADMDPASAIGYLSRGVEVEMASNAHGEMLSMLGLRPVPIRVLLAFGPLVLVPLWIAGHDMARNAETKWPAGAQVLVGLSIPTLAAVLGLWLLSAQDFGGQIRMLTVLWALLAAGSLVVAVRGRAALPASRGRGSLTLVLVALFMPYVATVGTNTNFVPTMTQASVFWAIALMGSGAVIAANRPEAARLFVPLGLFLVTTTAVTQVVWFGDGLEGQGVRDAAVSTRALGGKLLLEPETAAIFTRLDQVSAEHGMAGQPAIDLTGYGAAYQLALGTRPLGRASFFGTFAGAERGAEVALGRETCPDLASAVVLYADDNPLDVSHALSSHGLDLDSDYVEVTRFHPTHGTERIRRQTVRVLLPKPGVPATLGCAVEDA
ncbi:hypothetical protein [uncultured Phycicoccus sp.]|uniref:hypothetical protein n=1 Tax=uncultured Phycicoccus sp. TaxID=661422 RepID=UPI0026209BDE|nr:hypothetical protein [uncultured Phycicoccus sp.]